MRLTLRACEAVVPRTAFRFFFFFARVRSRNVAGKMSVVREESSSRIPVVAIPSSRRCEGGVLGGEGGEGSGKRIGQGIYLARPLQPHFANVAIRMRLIALISRRPASNVRERHRSARAKWSSGIFACYIIEYVHLYDALRSYTVEK